MVKINMYNRHSNTNVLGCHVFAKINKLIKYVKIKKRPLTINIFAFL